MPCCNDCAWISVNPVNPALGECKVVVAIDRVPAHLVKSDDDASKCKHFKAKEEKEGASG